MRGVNGNDQLLQLSTFSIFIFLNQGHISILFQAVVIITVVKGIQIHFHFFPIHRQSSEKISKIRIFLLFQTQKPGQTPLFFLFFFRGMFDFLLRSFANIFPFLREIIPLFLSFPLFSLLLLLTLSVFLFSIPLLSARRILSLLIFMKRSFLVPGRVFRRHRFLSRTILLIRVYIFRFCILRFYIFGIFILRIYIFGIFVLRILLFRMLIRSIPLIVPLLPIRIFLQRAVIGRKILRQRKGRPVAIPLSFLSGSILSVYDLPKYMVVLVKLPF